MTLGAGSELEIQRYKFQPHKEEYDFSLYLKRGSVIYSSGKLGRLAPGAEQTKAGATVTFDESNPMNTVGAIQVFAAFKSIGT